MTDENRYYHGKSFSSVISKHPVAMTIQTIKHKIRGNVHVRNDERSKDALNTSEHFIAVTDVEVFDEEGHQIYKADFIAVHRDHIIWAAPINEPQPGEDND
jgi:hypothetical protein